MDIYELWFEWLRRAYADPKIKVVNRVRSLLGESEELGVSFGEWWEDHHQYFEREAHEPLRTIDSAEEYESWAVPDMPELELVVSFNMCCSKEQLIEAFKELLDTRHGKKRGRPKKERMAEFDVVGYHDIKALEKTLKVYDFSNDLENGDLKLYQIGEKLKLNLSAMPHAKDKKRNTADKRKSMTTTVSRYLRWAREIKQSVATGECPKHGR